MARTKGNKVGSIFYDKNAKKWRANYYMTDLDSKEEKRYSKSFITEKEAKDFLETKQYQKNNELYIKNNGIPLNQLMKTNARKKADMNLISETQYARILKTIEVIEKSPMSYKLIENITSDEIQDFLNTLKNYSNSYIKKIYEQFTQSYNFAMNKGYITKNPLIDVIKPKSTKPDKVVRALEIEEQQKLTDYLMSKSIEEEPYKNVFLIQMYMGLRVGEVLALRNSDIDLKWNLLKVNKTLTTNKNGKIIMGDTTKTYAGIREVPIPEYIRGSIIEQMKVAENNKDNQLFLSPKGNYVDGRNANEILKMRLAKLGITGISTHSLRHTYGTRCVEAGMRAVALQRLMGHKDVSVTLNTYTSVFNKYKESELQKVNEYYMNNSLFNTSQLLKKNAKLLEEFEEEKDIEEENEIE
jgi:integrase